MDRGRTNVILPKKPQKNQESVYVKHENYCFSLHIFKFAVSWLSQGCLNSQMIQNHHFFNNFYCIAWVIWKDQSYFEYQQITVANKWLIKKVLFILIDVPPPLPEIPEHATYILVGAGTASFAAYRAIRKNDNNAKVPWARFMLSQSVFITIH